jgi:hypothetical protein
MFPPDIWLHAFGSWQDSASSCPYKEQFMVESVSKESSKVTLKAAANYLT